MAYSATLQAFLERVGDEATADLFDALEVSWPDEDDPGRYASKDVAAPGVGHFEARIESIDYPQEGVDSINAGISVLETRITLIDDDKRITARLKGPRKCRGRAATLKLGVTDRSVPYSDWSVQIAGILDRWKFHDGNRVDLVIRTNDRWLELPAYRLQILPAEWEDLPTENRGLWMPIIFGIWDSRGLTDRGFVPALLVARRSTTLRWDFIAHGWMQSVPRVYVGSGDTWALADATHYAINRIFRNGEYITLIVWDPAHCPAEDQDVRVDCSGLTLDGELPTDEEVAADPTANLAYNPVAQLRLWLRLYIRNLWRHGAYPDEVGIDEESWDAAEEYAERYGLKGSIYLGGTKENRTALDIISEWLANWTMFRPYFTAAGLLGMGVLDCRWPGYGDGSYFDLIREEDVKILAKPEIETDPEVLRNRVSVTHLYDAAEGQSHNSIDVQDLTQTEGGPHEMRMTMGPASRED